MTAIALSFDDGHPFPRLGPANRVTIIRAMLVALTAGLIDEPLLTRMAWTAAIVGTIVAILDGVDGWLARRTRMASAFGARIDMETDALLIMVLSLLVWRHGKAGGWILLGGLMRYAFIAAGWMLPWMAGPLTPTRRAKTISVVHVVGLIVALAPIVSLPLSAVVVAATLAVLAWSFAVDVGRLWQQRLGELTRGG
jgi:phosphatidylglycerophosphate synthase